MPYMTRFISFTKSNAMVLFSERSKVDSSSDMKKRKRIEKKEDSCEMSDFVSIQSLSNSEKTILVCHSVRKHFMT